MSSLKNPRLQSGRINEEKCPCIISDENKKCIDCGALIEDPVTSTEQLAIEGITLGPPLSEDAPVPDMKAVIDLIHLAEATAKEFRLRVARNIDPKDHDRPKLQMIGTLLIRIPHKDVWKELLRLSYDQAQSIGYKGNFETWEETVQNPVMTSIAVSLPGAVDS